MNQRVRPAFQPFFDAFSQMALQHPIHEAILLGVTDTEPGGFFQVSPDRDGFFQVMAGLDPTDDERRVKADLLKTLEAALEACPFSRPDKAASLALLERWKPAILGEAAL